MNAVSKNQTIALGLARVITTSIDRAQGAGAAKKYTHEKKQMKNARYYASKLALILRNSGELRYKVATGLRDNEAVLSITEEMAYKLRSILLEKGLPYKVKGILSRYCANAYERNAILRRFLSQMSDFHQFEVTFPDVISRAELASAEEKLALTFEEFSKSTYISA
jgi:hypothetical protein